MLLMINSSPFYSVHIFMRAAGFSVTTINKVDYVYYYYYYYDHLVKALEVPECRHKWLSKDPC